MPYAITLGNQQEVRPTHHKKSQTKNGQDAETQVLCMVSPLVNLYREAKINIQTGMKGHVCNVDLQIALNFDGLVEFVVRVGCASLVISPQQCSAYGLMEFSISAKKDNLWSSHQLHPIDGMNVLDN